MNTEKKLDDAISFISNSREELTKGVVVTLEGFQKEVAILCHELGNMPVGEMSQLSKKLQVFAESLQLLEDELKAQQDSVQQEILELNRKQKALKSYETTSHSDKNEGGNA